MAAGVELPRNEVSLTRSVLISNVSENLTGDQLRALFAFAGEVVDARLVGNKNQYAILEFKAPAVCACCCYGGGGTSTWLRVYACCSFSCCFGSKFVNGLQHHTHLTILSVPTFIIVTLIKQRLPTTTTTAITIPCTHTPPPQARFQPTQPTQHRKPPPP